MDISSPDKLIFPGNGITKAEVVAHYQLVGHRMVDFLGGRPLTIERYPRGIGAKGFMQKNAAKHFPESIRRLPVPKRGDGETVYRVSRESEHHHVSHVDIVCRPAGADDARIPQEKPGRAGLR